MTNWAESDRIESRDGLRYLAIETTEGDLFRFVEHTKFTDTEYGQTYSYFTPTHFSGLYGSADDAIRDAHKELPWLREINSN